VQQFGQSAITSTHWTSLRDAERTQAGKIVNRRSWGIIECLIVGFIWTQRRTVGEFASN
jgi:hypothetical protein